MPGSGKTTVGRLLSKSLNLKFVDLDEYIEKKTNLRIREIFSKYGESYFRELEGKACEELAKKNDHIISTGGKTLLFKKNLNLFLSSSLIITLLCKPEKIIKRLKNGYKTRPLLSSNPVKSILKLYKERIPIYQKFPNKIKTDDLASVKGIRTVTSSTKESLSSPLSTTLSELSVTLVSAIIFR